MTGEQEMTGKQESQEKQGYDWLRNDTLIAFLLAILGALVYGVTIFQSDYFENMQRGENGRVADQMLDHMRRPFLTLMEAEVNMLQSTEEASAISDINEAIYDGRQMLSTYLKFASYNEELQEKVMQLKASYEAWASLELELANKKAAHLVDPGNRTEHGELDVLVDRSLSAFLNVMDALGDGEKPIHDDIEAGAAAVRGLLVSTVVFIAYLIALAFWREWSNARRQRRHYETVRQLFRLSHTDSLTGLANRVIFEDRFSAAIAAARRYGRCVGVLYLDIDKLKEVNDKMGHQAGDSVLREVAMRLQKYTREMDTAARVGGDEFVVLVTHLKHKADARAVADKLSTALSQPFELSGKQYSPRVSIGIAVFPDDGEQPGQLIYHADSAMYEAKRMNKLSFASLRD